MLNENIRLSDNRIYGIWEGMKARCYNPNNGSYKRYGGRGIKVCDEWKNNSMSFIKWAYENGYDDKAPRGMCELDRIDNDKGYSPDNCRWVDNRTNSRNMGRCHIIEYNGEKRHWLEWCEILGISKKGVEHCIERHGLTYQEAFDKYVNMKWNAKSQKWEYKEQFA